MSKKTPAKSDEAVTTLCTQRINGINAYTAGKPGPTIKAKPYTWPVLLAIYQGCIDRRTDLAKARANEESALAARDAADGQRKEVDEEVVHWAVNAYGADSVEAKAFGYVKPHRAQPSAETKAQAVAKAKATKAQRGETGKKKKGKASPPPAGDPQGSGGASGGTKA